MFSWCPSYPLTSTTFSFPLWEGHPHLWGDGTLETSNLGSLSFSLCIMCDCGSLHLVPSARRSLSDNDCTIYEYRRLSLEIIYLYLSICLPGCLSTYVSTYIFIFILLFARTVCFYPWSLDYPAFSSWSSTHCRAWTPSSGMGLKV